MSIEAPTFQTARRNKSMRVYREYNPYYILCRDVNESRTACLQPDIADPITSCSCVTTGLRHRTGIRESDGRDGFILSLCQLASALHHLHRRASFRLKLGQKPADLMTTSSQSRSGSTRFRFACLSWEYSCVREIALMTRGWKLNLKNQDHSRTRMSPEPAHEPFAAGTQQADNEGRVTEHGMGWE